MTRNNREQKNKQRECLSSPLTTNKNKKQNTTQTVDILPMQTTSETLEPVVTMEVDPPPSKKGKEKDTLEMIPAKTTTTLDVNAR
ncbi:19218_t:CDS:1, partial [Funneliformis geosporum]